MIARLFTLSLLLATACSGERGLTTVTVHATHPDPAATREIWARRFTDARNRRTLALASAQATLSHDGLTLTATLHTPSCSDADQASTSAAVLALASAHHTLTLHPIARSAVEPLATLLRQELHADVSTPRDRPGLLITDLSPEALAARPPPPETRLVLDPTPPAPDDPPGLPTGARAWLIQATPLLDGTAIASVSVQNDTSLHLQFTALAAQTLHAASQALRGEPLLFLLDDAPLIAPTIGSTLGDRFDIALPRALQPSAHALADALAAANLPIGPVLSVPTVTCRLAR